MVNNEQLNRTFHALADPTRRGIIGMLTEHQEQRIKELAEPFDMSMAAISKHIKVLEQANLISREKRGREFYVRLSTAPLNQAKDWIEFYEQFWRQRFMQLDKLLAAESPKKKRKNKPT